VRAVLKRAIATDVARSVVHACLFLSTRMGILAKLAEPIDMPFFGRGETRVGPRNNVLDGWFTLVPRGEYDRSVRRQYNEGGWCRRYCGYLLARPSGAKTYVLPLFFIYLFVYLNILIFNDCCQTNYLNIYRSDLHKTGRVRRIINCV